MKMREQTGPKPPVGRGGLAIRELRSPLAGPFTLAVDAGRCAVVMGPSGSGKSLFLRMVADLDPNDGEVLLGDAPRSAFAPADWRRRVTYVAAEAGWWNERVADHFAPDQLPAARALAGRMGLQPELFDALVGRLSSGEKQRLALVRALALEPPVLLLDEPTGALDQASVELVEQVLRERLACGTALLMVTHDPALARRLGDDQYRMAERRLSRA